MIEIKKRNYGEYSSHNYGSHTQEIEIRSDSGKTVSLFFSYDTIVAFSSTNLGLVVHKNMWGTTTGKHLNWIDGGEKKDRVDGEIFQDKLKALFRELGVMVDLNKT